jgi:hypothetical protein
MKANLTRLLAFTFLAPSFLRANGGIGASFLWRRRAAAWARNLRSERKIISDPNARPLRIKKQARRLEMRASRGADRRTRS